LAATVDFELEREPVALVEADHAGTLDRRNMHESIRLAIVPADEAETLHRVEELDSALGLFPGQLALRPAIRRRTLRHGQRISLDLEIGRGNPSTTIDQCDLERLALGKSGQACLLDGRNMNENVLTAIVTDNQTESLLA